jgi:diacylglycerol O-acyltransferase / wax synthase
MKTEHNHELLSYGDALFLYLEREGMPLNVATVAQFEGHIGLEECIAFVESKLPLIPRYRQRVVMPPLNVGLPCWEYDPGFDIRNHITEVKLRRGTEAGLKKLAAKLLSTTMDRSRPLWDFTLVHGLKDRTALLVRVHHCLADGVSGAGMLATLMDLSPVRQPLPKPIKFRTPKPQDPGSLFVNGLVTSFFSGVQRVLTAESEILEMAQRVAHAAGEPTEGSGEIHPLNQKMAIPSVEELTRLVPEFASAADRMPFNVVCRGPQVFEWVGISLSEIKAVKRCHGATVNDVFLTLITSAVRRYAEAHHTRTAGRLLRVIVPVSIRGRDKVSELGNRITFFPVSIPFARSPKRLIDSVRERTTFLKGAHIAELVGFFGTLLGAIPTAVQAILAPIASALPIPAGNIICTQVPGPREPLYLMGNRMLSCYPYVPIGGEFGMNCAVLTYNDTAHFGFSADVHAVPDLQVLPKYLLEAFEELKKASGIKKQRAQRPKRVAVREVAAVTEPKPVEKVEEEGVAVAMAGD